MKMSVLLCFLREHGCNIQNALFNIQKESPSSPGNTPSEHLRWRRFRVGCIKSLSRLYGSWQETHCIWYVHPDLNRPFTVEVDASCTGLGVLLLQEGHISCVYCTAPHRQRSLDCRLRTLLELSALVWGLSVLRQYVRTYV